MQDLAGKRILVTGASSGIGWELAKAFAAQDGRLALLARRRERLERLAKEIGESGGGPPLVVEADLAVRGQAAEAGAHVESELGGVDVLINNAGGAVGGSVWAVADSEEARTAFE